MGRNALHNWEELRKAYLLNYRFVNPLYRLH
jgi:hypothetical protein